MKASAIAILAAAVIVPTTAFGSFFGTVTSPSGQTYQWNGGNAQGAVRSFFATEQATGTMPITGTVTIDRGRYSGTFDFSTTVTNPCSYATTSGAQGGYFARFADECGTGSTTPVIPLPVMPCIVKASFFAANGNGPTFCPPITVTPIAATTTVPLNEPCHGWWKWFQNEQCVRPAPMPAYFR